ncbi:hypothetical protein RUM44_007220 [Polyplax serrata]|uniref:Uncharacterized protein n=1 Tax=Polyplax serrata TaxID=468196 RepID=A0ABR1B0J7_POLSC
MGRLLVFNRKTGLLFWTFEEVDVINHAWRVLLTLLLHIHYIILAVTISFPEFSFGKLQKPQNEGWGVPGRVAGLTAVVEPVGKPQRKEAAREPGEVLGVLPIWSELLNSSGRW